LHDRVVYAIGLTRLESVRLQPVETLSKGFKRRVGLAQALLHDPPVLVLDEPTDGLDPNQKHEVRELIKQMRQEKAIIISTHILEEVDAVCTRAIVIASGRIVVDATPAALSGMHPSGRLDDVFRQLTLEAAA
jgi:ABC-2 type transport system ATP-binding protein